MAPEAVIDGFRLVSPSHAEYGYGQIFPNCWTNTRSALVQLALCCLREKLLRGPGGHPSRHIVKMVCPKQLGVV